MNTLNLIDVSTMLIIVIVLQWVFVIFLYERLIFLKWKIEKLSWINSGKYFEKMQNQYGDYGKVKTNFNK
jgi:hypothetical protein